MPRIPEHSDDQQPMSSLAREARYVQNSAFGALLVWRFAVGFTQSHKTSDSPALPLGFLVLPILLHQETFELLRSTNRPSGLHGFAEKFSRTDVRKADLLLAIHTRAELLRHVSIQSLQIGVRYSLLTISPKDAKIIPLTMTAATGVALALRQILDGAEKLGLWCAQLSLFEVASTLKVAL